MSDSTAVEAGTILLVADDLGLSPGINAAVRQAHREGGLQAASLMLGQAASDQAVVLARETASLQVGWHVHVCDSQPLTGGCWPWGPSALRAGLAMTGWPAARRLVREEIRRQWAAFRATGLPCQFINGHHHLHIHPVVLEELERLIPQQQRPWLRGFEIRRFKANPESGRARAGSRAPEMRHGHKDVPRRSRAKGGGRCEYWISPWVSRWLRQRGGWKFSASVWGLDRQCAMDCREVWAAMRELPGGLHEFLFHPRQPDPETDLDYAALMGLRDWAKGAPPAGLT